MTHEPRKLDKGGDMSSEAFYTICTLILIACIVIAYFNGV